MRLQLVAFSCVVAATGVGAHAQTATSVSTPSGTGAAAASTKGVVGKDPAKVVCRTFDTTGSRLQKKRECHTNAEWAEINLINRRELDQRQAGRWKSD